MLDNRVSSKTRKAIKVQEHSVEGSVPIRPSVCRGVKLHKNMLLLQRNTAGLSAHRPGIYLFRDATPCAKDYFIFPM